MVLNENEPVTVRYASDFVSLDQAVSDLQAPKPETRWCLLELPPEQLKTLEEGQSFHFRELSGGVSQLLRFLVRFVCLDVTMLERPGSPLVVQITRFACLLASARITMDWTLACVSAWTQVSYSGSDLGMKDFKAGLRILASLKLPPVSRSLRRNVTGPSPEDLLPGGAARREEYWENATNATLRWNVDPSMSELHNMRRRAGYQHLATTTRYGDTCCASCGSIDTARLVRGTGFYAVASAESMQDHGIGLSAAQSLESWSEIKIVVADTCPHHGNEAWCPARQGRGNKFGVKHHFDFANPPAKYDNYYFVWTKIDCPYRVKRRYAQLSRNGGWWDGRQNLHCAGPFAVQRPSETCPQSSEIRAHCTLTSRSELSAIVLVASQHAVVFVIMSASAPGDGFAALCTSDSTFRVEFLENSNTLLLGQVKSVDKENAGGNCATLEQSRCNVFAQCRGQLILKPEKVDMNKVRELLLPSALGQVSAVDQQKLLTFQELQCKVAGSTAELKQVLHDGPYVELDGKWRLMPEKLKTQILDTALTVVTAHGWALEAVDGPSLLEEVQKTLPDGEVSVASLGVLQKALASVVAINPGREL
eukprot:s995_g8.t1